MKFDIRIGHKEGVVCYRLKELDIFEICYFDLKCSTVRVYDVLLVSMKKKNCFGLVLKLRLVPQLTAVGVLSKLVLTYVVWVGAHFC